MCGIVGYVGSKPAVPILVRGLERGEYRGYDSSGLTILEAGKLLTVKRAGKLVNLIAALGEMQQATATFGIAHTRWATHGAPTDQNAHPHVSCRQHVAVVHNGIITNYLALREMLEGRQHVFRSETDSETLAHLIAEYLNTDPLEAVRTALTEVEGTYALAVIFRDHPNIIIFAKNGKCPLLLGIGDGALFVASDAASFREHTDQYIPLEDGQIGCISADGYRITDLASIPLSPKVETLQWTLDAIEKGGKPHFMLKEIEEQPQSLSTAMAGRLKAGRPIKLGGLENGPNDIRQMLESASNIILTAAGTSGNAAQYGEILLQEIAGVPTQYKVASELAGQVRPCFVPGAVAFAISQSGETADLLHAMETLKRLAIPTLGIVNLVDSTIAREVLAGIYLHVGPEIGVASTKAYTGQCVIFNLLAFYLRHIRGLPAEPWMTRYLQELAQVPEVIAEIIATQAVNVKMLAEKYVGHPSFYFLGRGVNHPTALEGALKLKEVSYIHAEAYPSGAMKHGPIALITKDFPTVIIALHQDDGYQKNISNIMEIKARGGPVIAVATVGDTKIQKLTDDVIYVPKVPYYLTPLVAVVPLQLFAYYAAVLLGHDPDKPRNLAKAVVVE
ncbi:MAG: glutamine--fructose-6-phosphate transaminase (isomerizing) [Patescibacteria group bacterium]|jgi:glucosamine--fructose-6-phosphate aminotransferase (isomerizing)